MGDPGGPPRVAHFGSAGKAPVSATLPDLIACFDDLPDPRIDSDQAPARLIDIVAIALCAVVSGADRSTRSPPWTRGRSGHADHNLALVRRVAISLLAQDRSTRGRAWCPSEILLLLAGFRIGTRTRRRERGGVGVRPTPPGRGTMPLPGGPHGSALPTGTVTFLFTDIEGSTQRWEQHREAMARGPRPPRRPAARRRSRRTAATSSRRSATPSAPPSPTPRRPGRGAGRPARLGRRGLGRGRAAAGAHGAPHRASRGARRRLLRPAVNRVARLLVDRATAARSCSPRPPELVRDALPAGVTLRDLGEHRLKDLSRRSTSSSSSRRI